MKLFVKKIWKVQLVLTILFLSSLSFVFYQYQQQKNSLILSLTNQISDLSEQLTSKNQEIQVLLNEDQFKKNLDLQSEIKGIHDSYQQAVKVYEDLIDLPSSSAKTQKISSQFSSVLSLLSDRHYASASAALSDLTKDISTLQSQLAAAQVSPFPENLMVSSSPPGSGYAKQVVEVDGQKFVVDILSASLDSTKVVVETASESDCANDCPVASLSDFVSRSGGFAGINGPYFCPASYPSCAGKTNSFDTLLMNKNKYYFNSANNVYSNVPAMIFSGNSARLVEKSSDWGRDTGVDAVIANHPLLVSGGEARFAGDSDPKKTSRGNRSFIASKDNTVYIGVVRNASISEVAQVLKALGVQSALNLDSGGSTAFMVNGKYVAGPGRQTPFGIVLVRR